MFFYHKTKYKKAMLRFTIRAKRSRRRLDAFEYYAADRIQGSPHRMRFRWTRYLQEIGYDFWDFEPEYRAITRWFLSFWHDGTPPLLPEWLMTMDEYLYNETRLIQFWGSFLVRIWIFVYLENFIKSLQKNKIYFQRSSKNTEARYNISSKYRILPKEVTPTNPTDYTADLFYARDLYKNKDPYTYFGERLLARFTEEQTVTLSPRLLSKEVVNSTFHEIWEYFYHLATFNFRDKNEGHTYRHSHAFWTWNKRYEEDVSLLVPPQTPRTIYSHNIGVENWNMPAVTWTGKPVDWLDLEYTGGNRSLYSTQNIYTDAAVPWIVEKPSIWSNIFDFFFPETLGDVLFNYIVFFFLPFLIAFILFWVMIIFIRAWKVIIMWAKFPIKNFYFKFYFFNLKFWRNQSFFAFREQDPLTFEYDIDQEEEETGAEYEYENPRLTPKDTQDHDMPDALRLLTPDLGARGTLSSTSALTLFASGSYKYVPQLQSLTDPSYINWDSDTEVLQHITKLKQANSDVKLLLDGLSEDALTFNAIVDEEEPKFEPEMTEPLYCRSISKKYFSIVDYDMVDYLYDPLQEGLNIAVSPLFKYAELSPEGLMRSLYNQPVSDSLPDVSSEANSFYSFYLWAPNNLGYIIDGLVFTMYPRYVQPWQTYSQRALSDFYWVADMAIYDYEVGKYRRRYVYDFGIKKKGVMRLLASAFSHDFNRYCFIYDPLSDRAIVSLNNYAIELFIRDYTVVPDHLVYWERTIWDNFWWYISYPIDEVYHYKELPDLLFKNYSPYFSDATQWPVDLISFWATSVTTFMTIETGKPWVLRHFLELVNAYATQTPVKWESHGVEVDWVHRICFFFKLRRIWYILRNLIETKLLEGQSLFPTRNNMTLVSNIKRNTTNKDIENHTRVAHLISLFKSFEQPLLLNTGGLSQKEVYFIYKYFKGDVAKFTAKAREDLSSVLLHLTLDKYTALRFSYYNTYYNIGCVNKSDNYIKYTRFFLNLVARALINNSAVSTPYDVISQPFSRSNPALLENISSLAVVEKGRQTRKSIVTNYFNTFNLKYSPKKFDLVKTSPNIKRILRKHVYLEILLPTLGHIYDRTAPLKNQLYANKPRTRYLFLGSFKDLFSESLLYRNHATTDVRAPAVTLTNRAHNLGIDPKTYNLGKPNAKAQLWWKSHNAEVRRRRNLQYKKQPDKIYSSYLRNVTLSTLRAQFVHKASVQSHFYKRRKKTPTTYGN